MKNKLIKGSSTQVSKPKARKGGVKAGVADGSRRMPILRLDLLTVLRRVFRAVWQAFKGKGLLFILIMICVGGVCGQTWSNPIRLGPFKTDRVQFNITESLWIRTNFKTCDNGMSVVAECAEFKNDDAKTDYNNVLCYANVF